MPLTSRTETSQISTAYVSTTNQNPNPNYKLIVVREKERERRLVTPFKVTPLKTNII